jgi:arylsulfatase A-like enzyme
MIAWWPGTVKANIVSDHITAAWDFLPTACEMAGVEIPVNTDGISFLPLLKGEEQPSHEFLYWEYGSYGGQQAVRMGQWKGIRHHLADNPEAPLELYNLEDDPGETGNLAFEHPKIVEKIKTIMQEQHIMNKQFLLPIDTLKI